MINKVKKGKNSILHTIKEYAVVIIGAVILSVLISFFVKPGQVVGHSMDTTLANNDLVVINKLSYNSEAPKYKDILVFNTNVNNGEILIKRVIGVPSDIIAIKNNQLFINGELTEEKYIKEPMLGNVDMEVQVPKGKIFVMGDNRNNSLDSRSQIVGLIDYKKDVIGKVVFRMYPFNQIT